MAKFYYRDYSIVPPAVTTAVGNKSVKVVNEQDDEGKLYVEIAPGSYVARATLGNKYIYYRVDSSQSGKISITPLGKETLITPFGEVYPTELVTYPPENAADISEGSAGVSVSGKTVFFYAAGTAGPNGVGSLKLPMKPTEYPLEAYISINEQMSTDYVRITPSEEFGLEPGDAYLSSFATANDTFLIAIRYKIQ